MANTYDTSGEPLGSTAPKVLYNNASNLDDAVNSQVPSWTDRPPFNRARKTWWGMEQDFNNFLINSGYEPVHLIYVDGTPLVVDRPTQLIDRAGLSYRVKTPASFPVTLSGTWATDQSLLVEVSDASLRQDLAGTGGADLIGWRRSVAASATNVSRMLKGSAVNVFEFMTDADIADIQSNAGTVDYTGQLTAARNLAASMGLPLYIPGGTYRISSPITAPPSGMFGDGPGSTVILCNGCSAIVFPSNLGLSRSACIITRMRFASVGTTCDALFAISAPGVAAGAAPVYNSGITFTDVSFFRFGGCFYIKDCFEFNVDRVIATACTRVVQLVGSVVQSYFSRISAFSDTAPTVLSHWGFSTESATYSSGVMTPEHITTRDLSLIRFDYGIRHGAGLSIAFYDTDSETYVCGAYLVAPCTVRGGIIGASPGPFGWTGIQRVNTDFEYANGVLIDNVEINTLNMPGAPGSSFGIDIGDGVIRSVGTTVRNVKIKGQPASLNAAIYAKLGGATAIMEGCTIAGNVCIGSPVVITGAAGLTFNDNVCSTGGGPSTGVLSIADDGTATAYGRIHGNRFGSMSLTLTQKANWSVANNEGDGGVLPSALFASAVWSGTVGANSNLQTTLAVPGAALGDAVVPGYSGMLAGLVVSAFVDSAGVVRATVQNLTGSPINIIGTLRVLVYRL